MNLIKQRIIILCFAITSIPFLLFAQDMSTPTSSSPEKLKKNFAIGIKAGSLGPGLDFSMSLSKKLNLHLTGSYLKLNMTAIKDYSDVKVEFKTTTTMGAVGLLADWHPFEAAPVIKFTAGVMYNFNSAKTVGKTAETYSFNNGKYEFTPDDVGELAIEFKVSPIAPYIGVGFGSVIPKKKWGFNVELGTLYHGSPKVEFTGTGLIAPTAEQDDIVEENVKNYYLYPVLSFQLNYKIK